MNQFEVQEGQEEVQVCLTVPSTSYERYRQDFPSRVLVAFRAAAIASTYGRQLSVEDIGGGSPCLRGGVEGEDQADNDFELRGAQQDIDRVISVVEEVFSRKVVRW